MEIPISDSFADADSGELLSPVPIGTYLKPKSVALTESSDGLLYDESWDGPLVRPSETHDALWRFVKLKDADAKAILRYSKKWGVLGLDENARPVGFPNSDAVIPEPIHWWRAWARSFEAVLRLTVALLEGRTGEVEDWRRLPGLNASIVPIQPGNNLDHGFSILFHSVERCLQEGQVRVVPYYRENEIRLGMVFRGLFGLLSYQLLLATARAKAILFCSGCQRPYLRRDKLPKAGSRNWCLDCRKTDQPAKARRRRYQERKRADC